MQRMNIFLTLWENGAKLHVQCLFNVTKRGDNFLYILLWRIQKFMSVDLMRLFIWYTVDLKPQILAMTNYQSTTFSLMQRMNIFLTLWENGAKLHVQCLFNVTKRGDNFLYILLWRIQKFMSVDLMRLFI